MGKSVRMFNLLPGEREKRVSGALFTPQLLCTLLALIFFGLGHSCIFGPMLWLAIFNLLPFSPVRGQA